MDEQKIIDAYDKHLKKYKMKYACPICQRTLRHVDLYVYECVNCEKAFHSIADDLKKVSDVSLKPPRPKGRGFLRVH